MPTISMFYGILIKMFFDDHAPLHFHVEYAEFKAVVDIKIGSFRRSLAAARAGTGAGLGWVASE